MTDVTTAPQVSVVIPTYNRAHTVGRAVASAFAQEGVHVEVIVVDDGSSDATPVVLETLKALHGPALRVHRQANAGASAARNAGLALARGSFVQFLDSDDTLEPEKLRLQLEAYAADPAPTLVLCYGWLEEAGTETRIGQDLGHEPQCYIETLCGRAVHVIPTLAPLWRRAYLTSAHQWDPRISLGDDLDFHIRCLASAKRIGFVPEPLFMVHDHAGDRLSDFSSSNDRLASLLKTRMVIHETLVVQQRWTLACATNTAAALRSIYTIYLQRMTDVEVAQFDAAAQRMCGPRWRGFGVMLIVAARRLGGPTTVRAFFALAMYLRCQVHRFTVTRVANRLRRHIDWVARMRPREELAAWRTLQAEPLNNPEEQTALYVELNEYHSEIIPGYVALLAAAGYRTTVLHRPRTEVADALSRMPKELQPLLFPLTLCGMRRFLRSDAVRQYEVVMVGSGMLVERGGYFVNVFDFLDTIPNGRRPHLVIEHSTEFLMNRNDRFKSGNLFALRNMDLGTTRLPMLAPVEFGRIAPTPLSEPVIFVVIGRHNQNTRDLAGLFEAVRGIMNANEGDVFEVHMIGDAPLSEVPEDIRPVFRVLGRLPFEAMYDALDRAHYLLALLDSRTAAHRRYLHHNTTGTRQLSLGFRTPMVMDRAFADAYGFDTETALIHRPGRLQDGLEAARRLDPVAYERMQDALGHMKSDITAASLANLQAHLNVQETPT